MDIKCFENVCLQYWRIIGTTPLYLLQPIYVLRNGTKMAMGEPTPFSLLHPNVQDGHYECAQQERGYTSNLYAFLQWCFHCKFLTTCKITKGGNEQGCYGRKNMGALLCTMASHIERQETYTHYWFVSEWRYDLQRDEEYYIVVSNYLSKRYLLLTRRLG